MVSEIERIAEDSRRYTAQMMERFAEAKAQRESRSREYSERMAAEAERFWEEFAELKGQEGAHVAGVSPEYVSGSERSEVAGIHEETRGQRTREEEPPNRYVGSPEPNRQDYGAYPNQLESFDELDPRQAIARSRAARRRDDVVAPVDDDGDDEAEYYRRRSWLV